MAQQRTMTDERVPAPRASVRRMWRRCLAALGETPETTARPLSAWHFCENERDADALAVLVLSGEKRATTPSVAELEAAGEAVPAPGGLHVVTDWSGEAQCIIQTTHVEVVPFRKVTAAHAAAEGEGDGSLSDWRRTHRAYYRRILADTGTAFTEALPVACERFAVVWPPIHADRAPAPLPSSSPSPRP